MEPAKLIAYGMLVLLAVLAVSKLSRVLAPLLVIAYGLFVAPLVKSWYAFSDRYLMPVSDDYVENGDPSRIRSEVPGNVHSEALEGTPEWGAEVLPEGLELTKDEWLIVLATGKMLDSDGTTAPISKAKIAALVGIRAEDAGKMIDAVRGVESQPKPAAKPDPRFPESTKDGRLVSAALKGK